MEQWRPILGFEGLYEVSNFGGVRRVARGKKFTAEQIDVAKKMLAEGKTLEFVADFLRTSITTVFSIKHGKTWAGESSHRPVKASPDSKHYMKVMLCRHGKYSGVLVHRAVWQAFNGPIEGRLEVNHKNLDRADNRLENLELLTHRENIQHAHNIYNAERTNLPAGSRRGPRSRYAKIKHT
jgi:hypothetical protein